MTLFHFARALIVVGGVLSLGACTNHVANGRAAREPANTCASAPVLERYVQTPTDTEIGFSQAVRYGTLLFVSGTVGWGEHGVPEDLGEQLQLAYGHIHKTLEHFGATFADVVKETIYTTDLQALQRHLALRKNVYGSKDFPASSAVQVARLWDANLKIEIEMVVVVRGSPSR